MAAAALRFLLGVAVTQLARTALEGPLDWWQTTIFYQVYPRSFKDTDGDGIGDLNGITEMAWYFKKIGVGAIWLSPIYSSPMADFGYDISDYKSIDPIYGTMEDFQRLVATLKSIDVKLLMDFVPNHSSDQHEWFQKSVQNKPPYTDYYVWKSAQTANGERLPPNNWLSYFGGSAWEWNDNRKAFYYHAFTKQQPELNYRNQKLKDDMMDTMRYWLDLGVDGFRVDAVRYLVEDDKFRDEPPAANLSGPVKLAYDALEHIYTADLPLTYDIISEMRAVLDSYKAKDGQTRVMLTEAYTALNSTMKYYGTADKLGSHMPFNFLIIAELNQSSPAQDFVNTIWEWLDNMPPGRWANWVIGNHDTSRVSSRFGEEMADGMNMLSLLLPGSAVTYNGEELGMKDTFVRWDQTLDPWALIAGKDNYIGNSRDPERSPMQWDESPYAGFTKGNSTWLPVNPDYWINNYKRQLSDHTSHLKVYQRLAKLRNDPTFQRGDLKTHVLSKWTFAFTRSLKDNDMFLIVLNVGSEVEEHVLEEGVSIVGKQSLTVHTASINSQYRTGDVVESSSRVTLRPKSALVLKTGPLSLDSSATPRQLSLVLLMISLCSAFH